MAPSGNNKKYDFSGKVALVTGSSSGIGAAIATQFAEYGASVTITGRDSKALNEVAKQIESVSGKAPLQIVGDLLDQTVAQKLITQTVEKFGRLDILVNNAGGGTPVNSLDDEKFLEAFDRVMTLNLRSVVQLTHLAVPHLAKTKGNVINISSVAGITPFAVIYSTSKAALDMFTRTSANLLAAKGIRVNSINPGPVKTNFSRSTQPSDKPVDPNEFQKRVEKFLDKVPLKRFAQSVEIANLASFLASNDAINITGSIVVSDGGVLVYAPTF